MRVLLLILGGLAFAGNEADNGGDPLRVLFLRAQHHAAMHVGAADFSRHPWLAERQELLKQDLLESQQVWIEEPQVECAQTQTEPGARITLSFVTCRNASLDLSMAMELLIHESAHHLGVADEREADRIARAAIFAKPWVLYRDLRFKRRFNREGLHGYEDFFIIEHSSYREGPAFTAFDHLGQRVSHFNEEFLQRINREKVLVRGRNDSGNYIGLQDLTKGYDPRAPKVYIDGSLRLEKARYAGPRSIYALRRTQPARGLSAQYLELFDLNTKTPRVQEGLPRKRMFRGREHLISFDEIYVTNDQVLVVGDFLIRVYNKNLDLLYEKELDARYAGSRRYGDTLILYEDFDSRRYRSVSLRIEGLEEVARFDDKFGWIHGPYLVVRDGGGQAFELWDLRTGQHIQSFRVERPNGLTALAVSEDGLMVAAQESSDSTGLPPLVMVWDVPTGHLIKTFPGLMTGTPNELTFTDGGTKLVSARGKNFRVLYLDSPD